MAVASLILMLLVAGVGLHLAFTRPRALAMFLLPAGLFQFSAEAEGAGGLANLSAIWLLLLIFIALIGVAGLGGVRMRFSAVEVSYLVFLSWCVIEIARSHYPDYGFRGFLRFLFPFLSLYLARRGVSSPKAGQILLRRQFAMTLCNAGVHWGSLILLQVFMYVQWIMWYGAVFFDHVAMMVMVALACWQYRRRAVYAVIAVGLAGLCFVATNRTTIMAMALGMSVFALAEFRRRALVVLPIIYAALVGIILMTPAFRAKMFYSPEQESMGISASSLQSDNFNSNGRFEMWQKVLDQFYRPNPIIGSGLGSTQGWFYSGDAEAAGCGKLRVEHSEYVRMLADLGLAGLTIFAVTMLLGIRQSVQAYRRSNEPFSRIFSLSAMSAAPVLLVCMGFDNALLYVLPVAQIPLALAAIADRLSRLGLTSPPPAVQEPTDGLRWLAARPAGRRFADHRTIRESFLATH